MRNFPFPTPPEPDALLQAEKCLVALSALQADTLALTELGRAMAAFPLSPRHSRMLLDVAVQQRPAASAISLGDRSTSTSSLDRALPYAVALAAALTVESPFLHPDGAAAAAGGGDEQDTNALKRQQSAASAAHARLRSPDSDAISALKVCATLTIVVFSSQTKVTSGVRVKFCWSYPNGSL